MAENYEAHTENAAKPTHGAHYREECIISAFQENAVEVEKSGEKYASKKGKFLSGKTLTQFNLFWRAFNLKKGKAEAADAWLSIRGMDDALAEKIVSAAKKEAENRKALLAAGKTPKWAQGWLTGRRWEDEIYQEPEREYIEL